MWGKHTTMEEAARHPLIIRAPGFAGGSSAALVESLDIYPTLAELAGVEPPANLQGVSLVPTLANEGTSSREVAITQYKRRGAYGYSMRTHQYRYTEWVTSDSVTVYRDLYDMTIDPGETKNIAADPANEQLVNSLAALLRKNGTGLNRLNMGKDK